MTYMKKDLYAGFSCIINILKTGKLKKNQVLFAFKKSGTFDDVYLSLSLSKNWIFKYKAASFSNYQNIKTSC